VLIIRGSNCIITASGIVISVSDRPVCRSHCTPDGHLHRILYQINTICPPDEDSVNRNM